MWGHLLGNVFSLSPCADPGKTWTIALRKSSHARVDTPHIPPWSLSPDQWFSFRMLHISNMSDQITSNHHAASGRCGMHPLVCPLIQLVCRPVSEWWRIEPDQQKVQLRRFYPPLLYASLWRGHFTDLPGFADVQFDCNNESMSLVPSRSPTRKVCIQPTHCESPESNEHLIVWGQENHVVCLKSEQDLFQSASLPRTRSERIAEADLEHAARLRWVKHQNTIQQTNEACASKTSAQHFEKWRPCASVHKMTTTRPHQNVPETGVIYMISHRKKRRRKEEKKNKEKRKKKKVKRKKQKKCTKAKK